MKPVTARTARYCDQFTMAELERAIRFWIVDFGFWIGKSGRDGFQIPKTNAARIVISIRAARSFQNPKSAIDLAIHKACQDEESVGVEHRNLRVLGRLEEAV